MYKNLIRTKFETFLNYALSLAISLPIGNKVRLNLIVTFQFIQISNYMKIRIKMHYNSQLLCNNSQFVLNLYIYINSFVLFLLFC